MVHLCNNNLSSFPFPRNQKSVLPIYQKSKPADNLASDTGFRITWHYMNVLTWTYCCSNRLFYRVANRPMDTRIRNVIFTRVIRMASHRKVESYEKAGMVRKRRSHRKSWTMTRTGVTHNTFRNGARFTSTMIVRPTR